MSVIVKDNYSGQLRIFCKGSPQKLRTLSLSESVPSNFHQILEVYTQKGYRVLALAFRDLPKQFSYWDAMKLKRGEVEKELTLLGFLVMENELKPISKTILNNLTSAKINIAMATGDNALTAISVAKDCNIVSPSQPLYLGEFEKDQKKVVWRNVHHDVIQLDSITFEPRVEKVETEVDQKKDNYDALEKNSDDRLCSSEGDTTKLGGRLNNVDIQSLEANLPWVNQMSNNFSVAMTGQAFQHILHDAKENPENETHKHILKLVLKKSKVFSRMTPENKMDLVEALQDENQMVGMCGDGANDCSALKQADVGISLSEAEASIAAPFTSKVPDISCVVTLLREGRAALVTSIQCFKYIAMYSMIQFFSVTLLYWIGSNLSDWQYLYIDLIILLPISITMGYTQAYPFLTHHRPTGALISVSVLTSILGHVVLQAAIQISIYLILRAQPWYVPLKPTSDEDNNYLCYQNSTLFLVSNGMYLSSVLVFSIGKPFRRPLYTNVWFLLSVVLLYLFSLYLIIWPDPFFAKSMEVSHSQAQLMKLKFYWKLILLAISLVYLIVAWIYEKCVVESVTECHRQRKAKQRRLKERQLLGRNF